MKYPNEEQRMEGNPSHGKVPQRRSGFRPVPLAALLLSCALCLMTTTGCWDRREVNDIAIVIAFSLDKEPNGMIRLGIQVPLVSNLGGPTGGGGGTSGGDHFYVDSDVGRTVYEANEKIQARMSRQIYYAHHRVVIIGEALAKEGIGQILDLVSRFPENRLTAYMVLAKGRAVDLLKEQPRLERFSGEAIRELVKAVAIPVTLRDLVHEIDSPGIDPFLPVLQARTPQQKGKSGEIQVVGIALFHREKLISIHAKGGVKRGDVAKTLFWFHHRFNPIVYELVSRDGARFSFIVHEGRTKIHPVLQNGKIHFHIRLEGLAILVENLSDWNFNDKRWVDRLNREANAMIAQDTKRLIELIKTSKTDTMGLGLNFARHYPKEWKDRYRDRWDEVLPDIICEVTTKIRFSNVGQTTKNIMEEK